MCVASNFRNLRVDYAQFNALDVLQLVSCSDLFCINYFVTFDICCQWQYVCCGLYPVNSEWETQKRASIIEYNAYECGRGRKRE